MNLPCIAIRSSFCFFLLVFTFFLQQESFGQSLSLDTIVFYKHLKDENLFIEQIAFAQKLRNKPSSSRQRKDSLSLDLASAYYRMKMPDSCAAQLKRISPDPGFSGNKQELFFLSLLLSGELDLAEKNARLLGTSQLVADAQTSFSILKREKIVMDTSQNISSVILDLRNRYMHAPQPSPWIAGALSAVLPGAGKWYTGYKQQALTAFIANALLAAQAVESYSRGGVSSPQFIITAGLFGIFYSGNIWGSVLAAKKKKRDHLNEIDYEILDHYHTEFSKLSR